jgi:sirohydrochlorin ferrochelatase
MPLIVLLDNGSSRPQSTLSLRRLAAALGERVGETVHPVSLMHAGKVPAEALDGVPADTFEPWLRARADAGQRSFLVVPLFFGPSRALTGFIPDKAAEVARDAGPLDVRVADVLCPHPQGEPLLTAILCDNLQRAADTAGLRPSRAVLVDHGSPIPEVTRVRRTLARDMRERLGPGVRLEEAVMERRSGSEYDFNGALLEDVLRRLAEEDPATPVILAMLFMFAGRHAGPGGDVEQIYRRVEAEFPGLRVHQSELVSTHPALLDILEARVHAALRQAA